MKNLFLYLFVFFLPILNFSQSKKSKDVKEIYSIVNYVIAKDKLNKKYGFDLVPLKTNESDYDFLKTYLEKKEPEKPEVNSNSGNPNDLNNVVVKNISYPNKNVLSEKDITEMIAFKKSLKNFKWNNNFLKFNLKNESNFYRFSIPFINKNRDKVIVQYEFLCPGLCGNGHVLFLQKKNGKWENSVLEISFH